MKATETFEDSAFFSAVRQSVFKAAKTLRLVRLSFDDPSSVYSVPIVAELVSMPYYAPALLGQATIVALVSHSQASTGFMD